MNLPPVIKVDFPSVVVREGNKPLPDFPLLNKDNELEVPQVQPATKYELPSVVAGGRNHPEFPSVVVREGDKPLPLPIVVVITKDVKPEDLELFKSYGKVIQYEPCYNNIELPQLDFKYFFLDLRKPDDRVYYQKHVAPLKGHVKEVLYHHAFEEYEDFDVTVKRTKFPLKQATESMFHQLLFQPQLPKPRACLSFLSKVASYLKL